MLYYVTLSYVILCYIMLCFLYYIWGCPVGEGEHHDVTSQQMLRSAEAITELSTERLEDLFETQAQELFDAFVVSTLAGGVDM